MNSRLLTPRLGIVLLTSSLVLATACDQNGPLEGPTAVDSAALEAADGPEAERAEKSKRHHKKGHPSLLKVALKKLELSDEQRATLEKLRDEMKPDEVSRSAHQDFKKALAAAVRAGKVDQADFADELEAMKSKMAAKRGKHIETLKTLHATLSTEQRTTLVEELKSHKDRRWQKPLFEGERFDDQGEPGADDLAPEEAAEAPAMDAKRRDHHKRGRRGKRGGDPTMRLIRKLDLSEDQRAKLREAREGAGFEAKDKEAMKERFKAMKGKMAAFLTAFTSDSFDPSSLPGHGELGAHMSNRMERKLKMLGTVVPILDEAQRNKLADSILEGHKKKMRRMHRGR